MHRSRQTHRHWPTREEQEHAGLLQGCPVCANPVPVGTPSLPVVQTGGRINAGHGQDTTTVPTLLEAPSRRPSPQPCAAFHPVAVSGLEAPAVHHSYGEAAAARSPREHRPELPGVCNAEVSALDTLVPVHVRGRGVGGKQSARPARASVVVDRRAAEATPTPPELAMLALTSRASSPAPLQTTAEERESSWPGAGGMGRSTRAVRAMWEDVQQMWKLNEVSAGATDPGAHCVPCR